MVITSRLSIPTATQIYRRLSSQKTFNRNQVNDIESLAPDLQAVMHGNSRKKERVDSVTIGILRDRLRHQKRASDIDVDEDLVRNMKKIGLGSKRKRKNV